MTKHGRIISDVKTTDPDLKKIKMKDFRGTGGVFNVKGVTIMHKMIKYSFLCDFSNRLE